MVDNPKYIIQASVLLPTDMADLSNSSFVLREDFEAFKISYGNVKDNMNVAFLFLAGDIVLFLQAGFAFLEAGVVRSKNVTNILIKNMLDLFFCGISFWLVGWAFAEGKGNGFIGYTQFACMNLEKKRLAFWFFQCVFAATAATIISGAVAERCEFIAYMLYSTVISGFLYPVVAHWAWSDEGWLNVGRNVTYQNANHTITENFRYVDFSGSGVVHLVGGVCSFVGAAILGPRIGRFDSVTGKPNDIQGHSMPLAALGGFILVFGIMSFNGGTQGKISDDDDGIPIAVILVNTLVAGSFAALTSLFIYKSSLFGTPSKWSLLYSLNGALVGMVATCAGGADMEMWAAAIVGVVGGFIFFPLRMLVLLLKVDDPLDAVAVHFGGGTWGLIAGAIFGNKTSIIFGKGPYKGLWLAWNLAGWAAIVCWSATISSILFGTLKVFNLFRVPAHVELQGLDFIKHGERAYPLKGWEEDQYTHYLESISYNTNGTNGTRGSSIRNPTGLPHLILMGHNKNKGGLAFQQQDKEDNPVGLSLRAMHDNPAFLPDNHGHTAHL